MAMATYAQNKSKRRRNPNIYETCEHLNTTKTKKNQGKEKIYDGYGHWRTKQIQKAQKSKHLRNLGGSLGGWRNAAPQSGAMMEHLVASEFKQRTFLIVVDQTVNSTKC